MKLGTDTVTAEAYGPYETPSNPVSALLLRLRALLRSLVSVIVSLF